MLLHLASSNLAFRRLLLSVVTSGTIIFSRHHATIARQLVDVDEEARSVRVLGEWILELLIVICFFLTLLSGNKCIDNTCLLKLHAEFVSTRGTERSCRCLIHDSTRGSGLDKPVIVGWAIAF